MMTWVEISSSALLHNYDLFRILDPSIVVIPVIKSNAYGHGMTTIATLLEKHRHPAMFAVVNAREALEVREQGIKTPLLILSAFQDLNDRQIRECLRQDMAFPLYDPLDASRLSALATHRWPARVHLKVDIGTSRLGLRPEKCLAFVLSILKLRHVRIEGIFGHFASSEESDESFTRQQLKTFQGVVDSVRTLLPSSNLLVHVACSAAGLRYPESRWGAVRAGLALYGLWPSEATRSAMEREKPHVNLRPVLSWKTRVLQVKDLPAGVSIGYGCTDRTRRRTRLAILPVGYYEGWDRRLSNNGEVLIRRQRCRIRGRICMNLCMVDVTRIPVVCAGDEVVLIGEQGKARLTADEIAQRCRTIAYEIVSRINPLLPRVVISH